MPSLLAPMSAAEELRLDNAAIKAEFALVEFFKVLEEDAAFRAMCRGHTLKWALAAFKSRRV